MMLMRWVDSEWMGLVRLLQQVLIWGLLVFCVCSVGLLLCCFCGCCLFLVLLAPATESWPGGFYCKPSRESDFFVVMASEFLPRAMDNIARTLALHFSSCFLLFLEVTRLKAGGAWRQKITIVLFADPALSIHQGPPQAKISLKLSDSFCLVDFMLRLTLSVLTLRFCADMLANSFRLKAMSWPSLFIHFLFPNYLAHSAQQKHVVMRAPPFTSIHKQKAPLCVQASKDVFLDSRPKPCLCQHPSFSLSGAQQGSTYRYSIILPDAAWRSAWKNWKSQHSHHRNGNEQNPSNSSCLSSSGGWTDSDYFQNSYNQFNQTLKLPGFYIQMKSRRQTLHQKTVLNAMTPPRL